MNAAYPSPSRDADHLRILAVFHYVFAGLALLGIGFLALHYLIMRTVMSPEVLAQSQNPPPPEFLNLFVWFYAFFAAMMIIGGVLNLLVANNLRKRRSRMFCMVVAGLNCLQFPFGTVLGVFTLVTLSRDSVRIMFDGAGDTA